MQESGKPKPVGVSATGLPQNLAGALAYIIYLIPLIAIVGSRNSGLAFLIAYVVVLVLGIAFLFVETKNHWVRYHIFQAIFLGVPFTIVYLGLKVFIIAVAGMFSGLTSIGSTGSVLGNTFGFLSGALLPLAWLVLTIFATFSAYQGKKIKLPYTGDLAEPYAGYDEEEE